MKALSYYDLMEACGRPGCPVCRLLEADSARFFDALLYERFTDPRIQTALIASRGLCSIHGAQLMDENRGAFAIAFLNEVLVSALIDTLDSAAAPQGAQSRLTRLLGFPLDAAARTAQALAPEKPCMCCEALHQNEARYLDVFAEALTEVGMLKTYGESDGLCLPHFRMLVANIDDPAALEQLIAAQRAIWRRLEDALEAFIARHEFSADDQVLTDTEASSWRQALNQLMGRPRALGTRGSGGR
jgi:hypothetical protein